MATNPVTPDRNSHGPSLYAYQKRQAKIRAQRLLERKLDDRDLPRRMPACSRCAVKHEEHAAMGCSNYTETRLRT